MWIKTIAGGLVGGLTTILLLVTLVLLSDLKSNYKRIRRIAQGGALRQAFRKTIMDWRW